MNIAIKKPHNIFITLSLALALSAASGSVSYARLLLPRFRRRLAFILVLRGSVTHLIGTNSKASTP